MKRILSAILALLMMLSLSTAAFASEAEGEVITLTAFLDDLPNPSGWEWGMDPTSRKITELTGCQIDITYATTTDHTELTTLLASGEALPDFIITRAAGSTYKSILEDQGFVLFLQTLADEYCPEFYDVLPKDMDKIYQAADGQLYCVVDWYGDENKYDTQILNSRGPSSITLRKDILEELGNPEITNWDEYVAFLEQAKAAHPEINYPIYDQMAEDPRSSSSLLNMLARFYGLKSNFYVIDENDKITMNFMTEEYKKALKAYNDLFRRGLINPEQYVLTTEQQNSVFHAQDIISYCGYYWQIMEGMNILTEEVYRTIEYPLPTDGVTSEELCIHDDFFGIGGGRGVFISKDCSNPEAAIKYLTFMLSDEGQILQRYGTEGVSWEPDEYGRSKETQLKKDTENESFTALQRDLGVYNYDFSWITSNTILVYGAHNTYAEWPGILNDFAIQTPHQRNERLYDMTYSLTDADGLVLLEQMNDLWDRCSSAICLAESDEEFESLYQDFISQAEKTGVDRLEEYFEANLQTLRAKGL